MKKGVLYSLFLEIFFMKRKIMLLQAIYLNRNQRLILSALLGSFLLTIGSLIRIPFDPVLFTLQTLALFILALTQSPKEALASTLCYLLFASIGLPVLDGKVNFLWITGKSAGYLLAFPIAAYLMAYLRQKCSPFLALLSGQVLILFLGWVYLCFFLGFKLAFIKGVLPFIFTGIFKVCAATSLVQRKVS